MNLVKIEGHSKLRKNLQSGAIVNVDKTQYDKNIALRNRAMQDKQEQIHIKKEIDSIKGDILEIKNLITALIDK